MTNHQLASLMMFIVGIIQVSLMARFDESMAWRGVSKIFIFVGLIVLAYLSFVVYP